MTCTECNAHHDEIRFVLEKILDCGCTCHEHILNKESETTDWDFDFE